MLHCAFCCKIQIVRNVCLCQRKVFPKSRLPVSSPNRRRERRPRAGNVRICYAISDSCKRTSCQKANFFSCFNLVLSFFYFPPVRAIAGKFDSFFCLVFASRGLQQGFHEKYSWNGMRRKIFHQENRRWALRQSFEMQSTLRKKVSGFTVVGS